MVGPKHTHHLYEALFTRVRVRVRVRRSSSWVHTSPVQFFLDNKPTIMDNFWCLLTDIAIVMSLYAVIEHLCCYESWVAVRDSVGKHLVKVPCYTDHIGRNKNTNEGTKTQMKERNKQGRNVISKEGRKQGRL